MRVSHFIRRKSVSNVKPAIRLAEQRGTPLNQFVSINFHHTACNAEGISPAFAKLRDNHFTPWVRRPPAGSSAPVKPAAFIWVLENVNGHVNAHWLVHVPPGRLDAFKARLPKWLTKVTGGVACEVSAINVRSAYRPFGAAKYMMKGIDPVFAQFYRITSIPQGQIFGKRCGFSRSLGPAACREARTYFNQMRQDGKVGVPAGRAAKKRGGVRRGEQVVRRQEGGRGDRLSYPQQGANSLCAAKV